MIITQFFQMIWISDLNPLSELGFVIQIEKKCLVIESWIVFFPLLENIQLLTWENLQPISYFIFLQESRNIFR